MSTHTFGVTGSDPFGIATADFVLKGIAPSETYTPVIADDGIGEYVSASQKSVGGKTTISATYGSIIITAVAALEITAGSAAAAALESVTVSTNKGTHATGTARGHYHVGGTNSNHNDTTRTLTIPSFAGFGASAFGLTLGVPEASLQSSSYTIELGHTDEDDKDGNFLAGTCHGEKHTATFEAVDETAWSTPLGWVLADKTPDASNVESNSGHMRRRATFVKYIDGPT